MVTLRTRKRSEADRLVVTPVRGESTWVRHTLLDVTSSPFGTITSSASAISYCCQTSRIYNFHLNCIISYSTKPNCLDHPERPTHRSRPRGHGLSHHLIVNLHLHLHHLIVNQT